MEEVLELGMHSYKENDLAAALLCLDHVFASPLQIADAPLATVVEKLDTFSTYATLLSAVTFRMDPCKGESLGRLFGFSRVAENVYRIPQPTWLYSVISRSRKLDDATELTITVPELQVQFRTCLKARLTERAQAASDACYRSRAFLPCLSYVVFQSCPRRECPDNHITSEAIDPEFYNQRVRIHLQQILILQNLRENTGRQTEQRGPKYV